MTNIGAQFRALHKRGDPFTLMNAWDAGSAKLLAALGAQAIGTTSAGHAFTLGRPDMGNVSRDKALAHTQDIVAAANVPVSGDFENGYGDDPETVAQTIRLAAEVGLAGCSIEDTRMSPCPAPYDFDLAQERIRAAASAARTLPQDFVLVARADGIMNGFYDIEEAIKRLQAFDAAGADCLYAPLPKNLNDLQRILKCTQKPVNVLVSGPYAHISRFDYAQMGAARLSLGSGLARLIHKAILTHGKKIIDAGDFSDIDKGAKGTQIDKLLAPQSNQ